MFKTISYPIVFLGAAALLTLAGCAPREASAGELDQGAADGDDRITVRVVEVERADFTEYGRYFGEVRGITRARLQASAGGTVEAIEVGPGDAVRRGQSLARIEADRAVSGWDTAVLAEQLAREAYDRERRFMEQGITSKQQVDQARLEWLRSRQKRIDAEAVREGALAISPIDGIVTARHIELYDELPPGAATFSVADLSRMKITVGVPEADIAGVRELGHAQVRFSAFPDRTWPGEVVSFARSRSDGRLTFDVEIEIDNDDGLLLAGQTARVELALRTRTDAVQVPSRALVSRGPQTSVFIVQDGIAHQRQVRLGPADTTHTVIIDGLSGEEKLVVEGMNRLSDGATVRTVSGE